MRIGVEELRQLHHQVLQIHGPQVLAEQVHLGVRENVREPDEELEHQMKTSCDRSGSSKVFRSGFALVKP